ncbi:MAG: tripartite tricarboxylate transporter TctB family protein [Chelatococcus sp.]|jgi:putative tricarboxylic transport membrane protein|uniref:tripartite tricarboxylate transporter TctB family protein n=1 Tax=Chelatococcus sp. TaxID=1953771 RepID=UPI0025B99ADB|nr:tripartite tricarboxylate transporter TctB family protein [Chelatococcus sp.]MBX3540611.1 tripartite tricarboxylate transporter TctB family protein [Chelatococcus sp.]
MRRMDIAAAIFLLLCSALVVLGTRHLPYWADFAPGPAFASIWVAVAGFAIGAALLVQAFRRDKDVPVDWPDRAGARQVLLGIGTLWLLLILMPLLGTALSGLIFVALFLLVVARRPVVPSLITSVVTVALIEGVFGLWLNVDLPKGLVGF